MRMTRPFAQTLEMAISNGVSGKVRRCSIVPCSRSRISAAPVRTTVSVVIWLMRATIALNQDASPLGLNSLRMTTRRGSSGFASRAVDERVDAIGEDVLDVAGADARLLHGGGVHVHLHLGGPAAAKVETRTGSEWRR